MNVAWLEFDRLLIAEDGLGHKLLNTDMTHSIPSNVIDATIKCCVSKNANFKAYYPGKGRALMMKGSIKGTVLSGHPTKTTLGNTLRLATMIDWLMEEMNIPKGFYA
jgi:hypothetical protein